MACPPVPETVPSRAQPTANNMANPAVLIFSYEIVACPKPTRLVEGLLIRERERRRKERNGRKGGEFFYYFCTIFMCLLEMGHRENRIKEE